MLQQETDPIQREKAGVRASDDVLLLLDLDQSLVLLAWTGRCLRTDKRGSIPSHLVPILERLQIRGDHWLETIRTFGRSFKHLVGRAETMLAHGQRLGRTFLKGLTASRLAFG